MCLRLQFVISIFFFSSRRRHTRWPRDWSSDVCSSDLASRPRRTQGQLRLDIGRQSDRDRIDFLQERVDEIGRASCREREYRSEGAVTVKKKGEKLEAVDCNACSHDDNWCSSTESIS